MKNRFHEIKEILTKYGSDNASEWSFKACAITALTLATESVCEETLQLNNTIPCKLQLYQIELVRKPTVNSPEEKYGMIE